MIGQNMQLPELNVLTPREREVLTMIGEGKSLLDIAQTMCRSLKTVESHRLSLGKKLNASNRVDLAKIAIAHGLVNLPEPYDVERHAHCKEIKGDTTAQRWADPIADRIYDRAGADYLNELSCALCDVLDVEHAGVCVPEEDETGQPIYRSLAYSVRGEIGDQFTYEIANTPCGASTEAGYFHVPRGISKRFTDKPLLDLNAESFAGICLRDHAGDTLGVLWMLDIRPMEHSESIQNLLHHFAARVEPVVADLNRTRRALRLCEQRGDQLEQANRELQMHNEQLNQLVSYYCSLTDRMSDGLAVLDQTQHIKYCNDKFAEITGRSKQWLVGQRVEDLLTEAGREQFRAMQTKRQSDTMEHYKTEYLLPNGEVREIFVAPRTLFDKDGNFAGSFAVITNLADMQEAKNRSSGAA